MTGTEGQPPVGSVGEEAVKLLQALQEWAKESGEDLGESAAAAATGAGSMLKDVNEHIATGGRDCTYCPVCQVISAVRATSPEVKEHLTVAASSLLQAAAGLLAARTPDAGRGQEEDAVERIDLTDDGDWEED